MLGFAHAPTRLPEADLDPRRVPENVQWASRVPRLAAAPRPVSRGMPGEKVLSREARTADSQAQTTSPRVHCTSQPRPCRRCPWQQSLSLLPSHPQRAGTGKRLRAGGGIDCHQRGRDAGGETEGKTGGNLTRPNVRRDPPNPRTEMPRVFQSRGWGQTESVRDVEGGKDLPPTPRPRAERDSQRQRDIQ